MGPAVSIDKLSGLGERKVFGRSMETAWLDACWKEGAGVASVIAPGGVGKSALVWDWLRTMQGDGWRGAERVYGWSFYSQGTTDRMTSADPFVSDLLRWLGDPFPDEGSPWEKGKRLARTIRQRRTLLVLDGVEPLQWGLGEQEGRIKDPALATLVRTLGAQNEGLCVITSRLPVRDVADFAEQKCQILDLGTLSDEAGEQVLRAWGAAGVKADLRAAVREYGGHALALALLGSYLQEVAEGDVRRRKEIGPLEGGDRLGGHARRVMAAYETMLGVESPEVGILRMLGLFDRPAGEDEIAALREAPVVAGLNEAVNRLGGAGWNRAVERLRRLGIVEKAGGGGDRRIDAHPLVREHFGEQLRVEKPRAWREGHRRLYELLRRNAKPLPENIDEMVPLYAAVVHGCRAGRSQEALEEVWWRRIRRGSQAFSISKLGAFGSEVAVLSAFFDPPWEKVAPRLTAAAAVLVLSEAGVVLQGLGRLPEAAQLLRLGLSRCLEQDNHEDAAVAAANLGEHLRARGELREALEQARKGVELSDRSREAFSRMAGRTTQAAVQHAMGLQTEAAALFAEAERMQKERQPDYPRLHSIVGFRYCDVLLDRGLDAEVRERAAQMLASVPSWYWLLDVALEHLSLGRAHLLGVQRSTGGNLADASLHLAASVDGLRRSGHQDYLPSCLLARAALHIHTRTFADARDDLDEALSLAERCGFRLHEADAHLGYARLCLEEGKPEMAREHLGKARAIVEETGYHRRDEELKALEARVPVGEEEKERKGARARGRKKTKETGSPNTSAVATFPPPHLTPILEITAMTEPASTPVDFLLVTALEEERDALLSKLPGVRKLDRDGTGAHTYYEASVVTRRQDGAVYRVVVTSLSGMGPIKGAIKAGAIIQRWSPAHVLMVGIAGGVAGEVAPGDVMVASQVADATVGKVRAGAPREERWTVHPADADLLDAASNFPGGWEDLVSATPPGPSTPRRHVGVIASGGDVVASKEQIASYVADWPKLLGVEMEGGGVAAGLHDDITRPRFLMIRGVSDLADGEDNAGTKKAWRTYACHVAAAYAIGLLRDGPVKARPR